MGAEKTSRDTCLRRGHWIRRNLPALHPLLDMVNDVGAHVTGQEQEMLMIRKIAAMVEKIIGQDDGHDGGMYKVLLVLLC
jgi:hypothetical protein